MQIQKFMIHDIPAFLWGEASDKLFVYVHGKMSCKEYAADFAEIANQKGFQTLSFDLPEHGERIDTKYRCDIWNGMQDLTIIADYAFSNWSNVSLFACSLGAFFSLHTYGERNFRKCLFQSPVLDMEYLIHQMFVWFDVTKERLYTEKEISTPVDTLRWDYYQYVIAHPITSWDIPTSILFGGRDTLQTITIVQKFSELHHCKLTISHNSEHHFMDQEDISIIHQWFEENIE